MQTETGLWGVSQTWVQILPLRCVYYLCPIHQS